MLAWIASRNWTGAFATGPIRYRDGGDSLQCADFQMRGGHVDCRPDRISRVSGVGFFAESAIAVGRRHERHVPDPIALPPACRTAEDGNCRSEPGVQGPHPPCRRGYHEKRPVATVDRVFAPRSDARGLPLCRAL